MIICALPLPCIGARKPKTEDLNGSGSGLPFSTKGSPHVQNRFERRAAARAPLGRTLHGNFPGTYFRPAEKGWSSNMIEVKNLTKRYGTNTALNNVSFTVEEGTIVGFLGPNGAGKSTLLRVISGIYRPDSGSVTIDKTEVYDRPQAKENIFFVSDETLQFSRLTVNDLKSFYQSSYPTFDDKVFDDLISKLNLPRKKPLSQFSKGMKRQAIVAAALACRTKYILLDEAFDGLDPAMRRLIRTMIVDDIFDRGATLIVSSHNVTEIGELCDRAMLLHKGEVIFAKDIDDVREGFEKVQIALPDGELDRTVIENAGVEVLSFKTLGRVSTVITKGDKADITAKLSALSPAVLELVPLTLEEIFIYEMEVRGYAVSEE